MKAKGRDKNRRGEVLGVGGGRVHGFQTGAWHWFALVENSPGGEKQLRVLKWQQKLALGRRDIGNFFSIFSNGSFFFSNERIEIIF